MDGLPLVDNRPLAPIEGRVKDSFLSRPTPAWLPFNTPRVVSLLWVHVVFLESKSISPLCKAVNFAGVNYYDGQGFLVSTKLGVNSAKQLDGASVCITAGTTTELNLAEYFKANGMSFKAITYDTADQVRKGFEAGRCDLITSDASQLYAIRTQLKDPSKYKVLPEIISKEPLGPLVRQGDDEWFNIAKWSLNALKTAEEFGVTSANVDTQASSSKAPEVLRLLGTQGDLGKTLGLDKKWAYNIIKQVGNYGESFERNVGMGSPLKIKRGLNALWKNGGLQYSPPFR